MSLFSKAYGAGNRAGRAEPKVGWLDPVKGTKVLLRPSNPYRLRRQFILRALWDVGYDEGLRQRVMGWANA